MQSHRLTFLRDERAASSSEFVLVLPIFLLLLFGMLDVAGYVWRMNMAQKASQFGARVATVTGPVAPGLVSENYVGKTIGGITLQQGDNIPKAALGLISCTSSTCTPSGAQPATVGFDPDAFARILGRMRGIDPELLAGNLTVEYRGSGLGYAGDPYGMEISPLVTVRISGSQNAPWQYRPWMGMLFSAGVNLPEVRYTLTMEDGAGVRSN